MSLAESNPLDKSAPLRGQVPPELKLREQWVVWRYEGRKGKDTKVPCNPRTGEHASITSPDTWGLLIEALEAYKSGSYDGVGFVFAEEDPFAGIDLDKVRDPRTGAVAEWATEWVEALGGYAEVSPSGTGLHIIVRGRAPDRKNQKAGVEAYSTKRFFTFTGDAILDAREIPERQDRLDRFCEKFFLTKRHVKPEPMEKSERQPVEFENHELLDKARAAGSGVGERFAALYDRGDFLDHASHSEARHELLKHFAFWTAWDAQRMSRLYEGSALYAMPGYAKKWARLGAQECKKAIDAQPRAYRQEARPSNADGGELVQIVEACRAMAASMGWEGRGGPMDRATYGALLDIAGTYGTIAKKGIIFSADVRTLALKAGTGRTQTIHNSLKRLREDRKLIRLSKKSTGRLAAVYLLRYPDATQDRYTKPCEFYVPVLSELRNPGPVTDKEFDKNGRKMHQDTRYLLRRVGKLVALVVEHVANSGECGTTPFELSRELDRRPDNVRRSLHKAIDAGLVVEGQDGRLRTPEDLLWRLETELQESGCNDARKQDAKRYRDDREKFRERREHKADAAPSQEDLDRARLQRVQDALNILQDGGTGPALILESYLARETKSFDYVVSAVAYYYGSPCSELWRDPVKRAVELITSQPA